MSEDHSVPLVTIHLLIESGSRRDPSGREGLANLTAKGLLLGTSRIEVNEFNEKLDFMGASLSAWAGRDNSALRLRVLKKDLEAGLDLLMAALIQPIFPEEEIERQIENTAARLRSEEERPGAVASKTFMKTLFLDNSYGHPTEGTEASLARISREDVVGFHRTYHHPNNAILAIVGDLTLEEMETILIPRLSRWSRADLPDEDFITSSADGPETAKIDRNITQANIVFGHRGISRDNPDYYAVIVMNYILGGGGFGSRLFEEIRVKRGLAYRVSSHFHSHRYPGSFQIVLQTKNASAKEAISVLRGEMKRIQRSPVSEQELLKAKKYLTGSFPLGLDTQTKLAGFMASVEYHGLGLDYPEKYPSYINGVTQEDVLRVAKTHLHPDEAILVIVANLIEAGL
jgi:zinc protease